MNIISGKIGHFIKL